MRKKHLKAQRTRLLERMNKRCESKHPNWLNIRCEFSIEEKHFEHIGENGYYVWRDK